MKPFAPMLACLVLAQSLMVGFLVYPPKFVVLNFGRWSKKGYRRVNMSNQRLRAVVIGSILNLDVLVA